MVIEKDVLICRRVLYIGSAVPLATAEGLEAVQGPLSQRYSVKNDSNILGILADLSVLRGGLNLQFVNDARHVLFFPISALTLCAAVRCLRLASGPPRFVSLTSPDAISAVEKGPAIFTTITRRTEGLKVLECHGFVCSSSRDAFDFVQCTSFIDRQSKGLTNGAFPGAPAGASFGLEAMGTPRGGGGVGEGGVGVGGWGISSAPPNMFKSSVVSSSGVTAGTTTTTKNDKQTEDGGEHSVRLVASERATLDRSLLSQQKVAPEFFEPPPLEGYFYKTKESQIKTYAVERITEGEAFTSPPPPPPAPMTRGGPPVDRRPMGMEAGPPLVGAGNVALPPGRIRIPVRAVPQMVRPRFFSPPPPQLRSRPMPMSPPGHVLTRDPYAFLPPHTLGDDPYAGIRRRRPQRRGESHTSSSSESSRSLSPGRRQVINGVDGDGSSDVSSRPRTPPTDYERGPRVSRKEQFDHSRRRHRFQQRDYAFVGGAGGGPPLHPAHPYDLYVYPSRYNAIPTYHHPPYVLDRARSVPAYADRHRKSKERAKSRKNKKDSKKKSSKKVHAAPSDVSTDSVGGYASELGPVAGSHPRMPRDFRRPENQFNHERAFSKSLAEQFRDGPGGQEGKAYSLNEHMVKRGLGSEAEFSMY